MSSSPHKVTTDALATLGTIIGPDEGRDAIHLAVEPVIASGRRFPGEHVGIVAFADGIRASSRYKPHVGIVDPFLPGPVNNGECFWLVVYPRTITSLRHVWDHPAFPPSAGVAPVSEPAVVPGAAFTKEESEKWLRDFVARSDCPDYDTVIDTIMSSDGQWDDDYLHFSGSDAHGEIPDEFWTHVENVTGVAGLKRRSYFSCSC